MGFASGPCVLVFVSLLSVRSLAAKKKKRNKNPGFKVSFG